MLYGTVSLDKIYMLNISYDEDFFEAWDAFIADSGIKNGMILSGYGTLDKAVFHCIDNMVWPVTQKIHTVEKPMELLSVDGIIANGQAHIHVTMSDESGNAFGGHLMKGSHVLSLCHFAIGTVNESLSFARHPENHRIVLSTENAKEIRIG